jgi:hypothetical protein
MFIFIIAHPYDLLLLQPSILTVVHLRLLLNDGKEEKNYKNAHTQLLNIHSSHTPPSEHSNKNIHYEANNVCYTSPSSINII